MKTQTTLISFITLAYLCGVNLVRAEAPNDSGPGVGPVTKLEIGALDQKIAAHGAEIFASKCAACHKFGERYVGPDLAGITRRRQPEWIMNMILNPVEMTQKDPIAQDLFGTFLIQMTQQNLTQDEARAVLEHFRSKDK